MSVLADHTVCIDLHQCTFIYKMFYKIQIMHASVTFNMCYDRPVSAGKQFVDPVADILFFCT